MAGLSEHRRVWGPARPAVRFASVAAGNPPVAAWHAFSPALGSAAYVGDRRRVFDVCSGGLYWTLRYKSRDSGA